MTEFWDDVEGELLDQDHVAAGAAGGAPGVGEGAAAGSIVLSAPMPLAGVPVPPTPGAAAPGTPAPGTPGGLALLPALVVALICRFWVRLLVVILVYRLGSTCDALRRACS